ncbi:MAG: redoxin domain-containing protein [Stagnimonas sp.]|nr:redoxin domain-containing protein [Stagnimonas sp.]
MPTLLASLPRRGLLALAVLLSACSGPAQSAQATPAPEFPARSAEQWINSAPLTLASLKGQVVLLDFWTFECWNCYRSFPWLNGVEAKFAPLGLKVVSVHTPEFEREKVIGRIREKVREFGIRYPVMVDSNHAYWNAMQNRYWPAFYLIDRQGRQRALFVGETHAGDAQAREVESQIAALLAEADR